MTDIEIRTLIIEMLEKAGSGVLGSSVRSRVNWNTWALQLQDTFLISLLMLPCTIIWDYFVCLHDDAIIWTSSNIVGLQTRYYSLYHGRQSAHDVANIILDTTKRMLVSIALVARLRIYFVSPVLMKLYFPKSSQWPPTVFRPESFPIHPYFFSDAWTVQQDSAPDLLEMRSHIRLAF